MLTPSTEVLGIEVGALGRNETVFCVISTARRLFPSVQLSSHLRKALRHETLIDKASDLPCVVGHVLSAHFVCWPADPIHSVLAVVAIHVGINHFRCGKVAPLLLMPCKLHFIETCLTSASHANLSVDAAGCLTEHIVFAGHEASVTRQVFSVVVSGLGGLSERTRHHYDF